MNLGEASAPTTLANAWRRLGRSLSALGGFAPSERGLGRPDAEHKYSPETVKRDDLHCHNVQYPINEHRTRGYSNRVLDNLSLFVGENRI